LRLGGPGVAGGTSLDVGWPRTAMVMLDETPWVVCVVDTPTTLVAVIASSYDLRVVGAVGMLFIFGRDSTWCFWMRDTPLRSGFRD